MTKDDAYDIIDALNNVSMSLEYILEKMGGHNSHPFLSGYIDGIDKMADNIEQRYLY